VETLRTGPDDGTLRLHTGVEGRAARLGHDLVLALDDWSAEVVVADGVPVSAALRGRVESLRVQSGSGGAKPLSDRDRRTIRANALGALRADLFPEIVFTAPAMTAVPGGFVLHGELAIAGRTRPRDVDVRVAEGAGGWSVAVRTDVVQTDHDVTPYTAMLGALRLRDRVGVVFDAALPGPGDPPAAR
jgi:polyisoprenoid-binding protein YceI